MDKTIVEALIRFISFNGIHAKVVNEPIVPHQDYGQKLIEFLTDRDTDIFAFSESGEMFLMNKIDSFERAWRRGIRFDFAFSMPKEFFREQKVADSMFFKVTEHEFAS